MSKIVNLIVDDSGVGLRLDKFLSSNLPDYSRVKIQKFISDGLVLCSSGIVCNDKNLIVKLNDKFTVNIPNNKIDLLPKAVDIPLDIVYEDDDIIILNKAAGMVVHSGAGTDDNTLVNALLSHTSGRLSSIGADTGRAGIVHRLDKDTSGLMMVCETDKAHLIMAKQFAEHSVKRDYYALVFGIPNPISGRIEKNIMRNPYKRQEMKAVVSGGKNAITNYEVIKVFSGAKFKPVSLVKCVLETGRTHQIRVHMSSIGTPILGDKVYGNMQKYVTQIENQSVRDLFKSIDRQMLHSKNIEFIHPITLQKMKFESKLPDDMQKIINFFEDLEIV